MLEKRTADQTICRYQYFINTLTHTRLNENQGRTMTLITYYKQTPLDLILIVSTITLILLSKYVELLTLTHFDPERFSRRVIVND